MERKQAMAGAPEEGSVMGNIGHCIAVCTTHGGYISWDADREPKARDCPFECGCVPVVFVRFSQLAGAVDPMRESRIARARGLAQAIAECRDDARLDGIREGAAEIADLLGGQYDSEAGKRRRDA